MEGSRVSLGLLCVGDEKLVTKLVGKKSSFQFLLAFLLML